MQDWQKSLPNSQQHIPNEARLIPSHQRSTEQFKQSMLQTLKHNNTGWGCLRTTQKSKFPPKNEAGCDRSQRTLHRLHNSVVWRIPTLTPENPPPLPACAGGSGWWWRWSSGAWRGPAAWYPGWSPSPRESKRILVKYQAPGVIFSGDKKPLSALWDCRGGSSVNTNSFNTVGNYQPVRTKDKNVTDRKSHSVPSLSKATNKGLLTICSDFSALSLISLILPKSCWMAFWASSRAWKRNKVRVKRESAFSFHLSKKYTVVLNSPWGWGSGGEQLSYTENTSSTTKVNVPCWNIEPEGVSGSILQQCFGKISSWYFMKAAL